MTNKPPFESVVTAHGSTVLRVCRAVLGRGSDADDAWSETFLAALRAWPGLPADANVEAWIVTIAHRKAVDITRSAARRPRPTFTGTVPERPGVDRGAPDPGLVDALARLPDRQRQAVTLHHLVGLPYVEVAALLGGTPEAARRAAADGIASLRRAYPERARS